MEKAKSLIAPIVLLLGAANAFPAAQSGFHSVGVLSGLEESSEVCGISADGTTILGYAAGAAGHRAIVFSALATKTVGDLSWTTFRVGGGQPFFDAKGESIDPIGVPAKSLRWTKSVGILDAPPMPHGTFSTSWIWCESADGLVFAGTGAGPNGTEAFRWAKGTDSVGLGDLPGGGFYSQANGMSADGSAVVGMSKSFEGAQAFLWTKAGGMVGLGMLPGNCKSTEGVCVSKDAGVVGGSGLTDSGVEAFVWTKAKGIQPLSAFMSDRGIVLPAGWKPEEVLCVSDDGSVLAGNGTDPGGKRRGWVLTMPKAAANKPARAK